MKNRLQFVHCDTLFKTSEEAKEYVIGGDLISYNRPALYAEPMVLKYGEASKPNILLAIGSVGNGNTPSNSNQVFFIDFADIEKSIADIEDNIKASDVNVGEIEDLLSEVIKSCGINADGTYTPHKDVSYIDEASSLSEADRLLAQAVADNYKELSDKIFRLKQFKVVETETIEHSLVETSGETTLSSNVKLSPFITVDNYNIDNILTVQNDGIYTNVRLSYDEEDNKLSFGVNDTVKDFYLPKENHIVDGMYDTMTESLILNFKEPINEDGDDAISIDLRELISEWKVMGEYSDTPIVLTKEEVKYQDILRGAHEYQDILKADVRVATADYKPYNILKKTENGQALYVDGIADNIKYLKNGQVITVKQALDEVDCNVSAHDGNIIYRREDGIFANVELDYVTAKNALRFSKTDGDGKVYTSEFTLNNITFLEDIYYDSLSEEIVISYKDATGDVKQIRIPVSSLFEEFGVDNVNHTVTLTKTDHQTSGQDKLSADVNISNLGDNILKVVNHTLYVKGTSDNIIHNASTVKDTLEKIEGDESIDGSIRNLVKKEHDERVNDVNTLTDKLIQQGKDLTCFVGNTESLTLVKTPNEVEGGYTLTGNINISSAENNIIKDSGALYASVDLSYDSATNKLSLITSNNINKEFTLNVGSTIQSAIYDGATKEFIITYVDGNNEQKEIKVPVYDLYNDWVVEDRNSSVIRLTKVDGGDGQPDVLQAELKLATPESGNLLQNTDGNLYASNKALDIKLSDHVGTNVEAAIVNLNNRLTTAEGDLADMRIFNVEDTATVDLILDKTAPVPNLKADVKISQDEGNIVKVREGGLYINPNDFLTGLGDFGTY